MEQEQAQSLCKILKGEYMGIDAYQKYLSRLHDPAIRVNLERHQLGMRQMVSELESYLRNAGVDPPAGPGWTGLVGQAHLALGLRGEPDDRTVLDAVYHGMKLGVDQTDAELDILDGSAKEIAAKHLQRNKDYLEEVVRYRNLLH